MNRIIVDGNSIDSKNIGKIKIKDGKIIVTNNGEYVIEYRDSTDISLEVVIKKGVTAKIFILSVLNDINIYEHYVLEDNSNLILGKFYDNKKTIEKIVIDLVGEYSKIAYSFSGISKGVDDYYYVVNHNNNRVESSLSNKVIGLDDSEVSFKIDSNIDKGNIDCVMDQKTRIITLGDVKAKIIPNMYIDEDSVSARHGSVISNISEDDIFYLKSRGIREDEAIYLLLKGFILSHLSIGIDLEGVILDRLNKTGR